MQLQFFANLISIRIDPNRSDAMQEVGRCTELNFVYPRSSMAMETRGCVTPSRPVAKCNEPPNRTATALEPKHSADWHHSNHELNALTHKRTRENNVRARYFIESNQKNNNPNTKCAPRHIVNRRSQTVVRDSLVWLGHNWNYDSFPFFSFY